MKKEIILSLILLAMSCFLAACGDDPSAVMEFSVSEEYESMAMDSCASQDGTIYIAAKNYILEYTSDGQESRVIEFPDRFISRVAFSNGMLYACDELSHTILELNQEGAVLRQIPLSITNGITKMLASEDRLYLMYINNAYENQLLSVSISDGSEEQLPVSDLYDIGFYDENRLLVRIKTAFCLYDLKTQETELYYSARHFGGGYAYDPQKELLYYINKDSLYSLDEKTQEHSIVKLLDHPYDKMMILEDTLVMFDSAEKYICNLNPNTYASESDAIHTYEFKDYSDSYIRNYTTDTGIAVVDIPGSSVDERFLKQLLSGDSRYDIFEVHSSGIHSNEFWENHAYTDLSVSETLVNAVEQMHKTLRDSAYQGEELAGIPLRASGVVMALNPQSEVYSLAKENIKDWDSFFLFLDEMPSGYTILGNKAGMYHFIFDQYLYGYCTPAEGNVTFDTEAFRKTLNIMKQIHDSSYFQEPGGQITYMADRSFRPTDVLGINNGGNSSKSASPHKLPDIEAAQSLPSQITVGYAVVNPNSEHKEEAIRYLEALVTSMQFSASPDVFPLPGYENWNLYMDDAYVSYELEIYNNVSSIINSWLIGQISKDEAIASIQEKANLILAE